MASVSLAASTRADTGKGVARKLRAAGRLPGVVYGHARQPQSLSLDSREVDRLFERIATASTVIDLAIDGESRRTLIREIQRHPVKRTVLHIDFLELVAGEKVTVNVPLVFQGVPVGVRSDGGIFEELLHEIEIEVDPADIPEEITVDVTELTIGDTLHVSDVKVPAGAEVLTDGEVTICLCSAPRTEEVVTPAVTEGEAPAEPELIRKPKEGDEADSAAEAE